MFTPTPLTTATTPKQRIKALWEARALLSDTPGQTKPAIFGGGSVDPVASPDPTEMIRIAEYISTGHDYRDTHPKGKRRPLITNVTVMAPPAMDTEDLEHFLHHVENGDFSDFVKDMMAARPAPDSPDEDDDDLGENDPDGGSK